VSQSDHRKKRLRNFAEQLEDKRKGGGVILTMITRCTAPLFMAQPLETHNKRQCSTDLDPFVVLQKKGKGCWGSLPATCTPNTRNPYPVAICGCADMSMGYVLVKSREKCLLHIWQLFRYFESNPCQVVSDLLSNVMDGGQGGERVLDSTHLAHTPPTYANAPMCM